MVASDKFLNYLLRTAVLLYHKYGIERSTKTTLDSYDFIVIGGGTAGAIVASELSKTHPGSHITDIPIISDDLLYNTTITRKFDSKPQSSGVCNGSPCQMGYGHVLGGSSTTNDFIYARGSKLDFTEWTKFGIKGWSCEDLLPYMNELESYEDRNHRTKNRGINGPVHVSRQNTYSFNKMRNLWNAAALEAGYELGDYNGPRQTYFNDVQKNIRNGVRQSTDNVYLRPIMGKRSNLHVIMFSHVTRILFHGIQATGVEFVRNGTVFTVKANREVILSAGALVSPQILMLSGIGPKRHLQTLSMKVRLDLPGVGRSLHDHPTATTKFSTNIDYPKHSYITRNNYELWKRERTGILASSNLCSIGFLTSNYSVNSNDSQIFYESYVLRDELYPRKLILGVDVVSARSLSSRSVELRSSDPFDNPVVDPKYLSQIMDKQNLINGYKQLFRLMKTNTFRQINVKLLVDGNIRVCSEQFETYSDDWIYCYIQRNSGTGYHYTSTCKMGPLSESMTVVDQRLRVRNAVNLRVIDASIMPQLTRGNTNAPTMMIGLKGADMIRQDWNLY